MSQFKIELGKGSWGTVYKIDEKRAVKIFKSSYTFESMAEIDILFRLKCPYLLKGIEINKFNNELGIIMELGNITLREIFPKLSKENLVNISYQLSAGILYLHNQGYYHLDLNSSNCLVSSLSTQPYYQVKIIDFGLSGAIHNKNIFSTFSQRVTVTERSPESFNAKYYSDKVDVWSLGMIFIEIFAGELPYIVDWEHTSDLFKRDNGILNMQSKLSNKTADRKKLEQKMYDHCIPNQIRLLFKDNTVKDNYLRDALTPFFPNTNWLDLLSKMLMYDPNSRISILEVTNHEVFKNIKPICDNFFTSETIIEEDNFNLINLNNDNLLQIKSILSYIHDIYNISAEALFIAIEMALKIFVLKPNVDNFKSYVMSCINISLKIFELENHTSFKYKIPDLEVEILTLLKGQLRTSLLWSNCDHIEQLLQLYNYIFSDLDILKKYFLIDYVSLVAKIENVPLEGKNFTIKEFSYKLKNKH